MIVTAIIASVGFVFALGVYQRHPLTMAEKRQNMAVDQEHSGRTVESEDVMKEAGNIV